MRKKSKAKSKKKYLTGFGVIFKYLGEYKKEVTILSILGVLSAILDGFLPFITGRLIDAVVSPSFVSLGVKTVPLIFILIGIWGALEFSRSLVRWAKNYTGSILSAILYNKFTTRSFSKLLELPVSYHKQNKVGGVIQRLNKAAGSLSRIVGNTIAQLAPNFLGIFVALSISFYINKTLSLVLVVSVSIYIFLLSRSTTPFAKLAQKKQDAYESAYADSHDAIINTKETKQVVSEEYEQKKLREGFMGKAMSFHRQAMKLWHRDTFFRGNLVDATQIIIFILSVSFIRAGEMTIGEMVMFSSYARMLYNPFRQLSNDWRDLQDGLIAITESEKILSTPTEIYEPENAVRIDKIKGKVEFRGVSFAYDKGNGILKGIDFDAQPGETIALVGESGAGKSTMIDLISGYYFAKKGTVLIDGNDVKRIPLKFLRSKIAVVSQEIVLFNDTIKNNIKYGSFKATDKEIEEAARKAHCSEFIEKFPKKWKQVVGERGVKLSVGQKQRVAIARAILRDPRILILDEPTSALDAKSEKFIQGSLDELMKGRTTFIIAHRLSTVRKADKILVLKDGKIIEEGKHNELIKIKDGEYRCLHELQIGLHD